MSELELQKKAPKEAARRNVVMEATRARGEGYFSQEGGVLGKRNGRTKS